MDVPFANEGSVSVLPHFEDLWGGSIPGSCPAVPVHTSFPVYLTSGNSRPHVLPNILLRNSSTVPTFLPPPPSSRPAHQPPSSRPAHQPPPSRHAPPLTSFRHKRVRREVAVAGNDIGSIAFKVLREYPAFLAAVRANFSSEELNSVHATLRRRRRKCKPDNPPKNPSKSHHPSK